MRGPSYVRLLATFVALAFAPQAGARVQGVDPFIPWLTSGLGPPPSDPFFGLPIAIPPAQPPVGLRDLPRPPALYDLYDTRPDFALPLPPSVAGPTRAGLVPATPPPPNLPAPSALPEHPGATPPAGNLRQALSEYDRRAGLGPAAAVASLSRELLQDADVWGRATLVVVVDAHGVVQMAHVLSSSRNDAAWARFAASLRGHRANVRVPPEARGLWSTIGVQARSQGISGTGGGPVSYAPGAQLTFDASELVTRSTQRTVYTTVLSEVWF